MQHSEPSLPDPAVGVADAIPLPADLRAAFKTIATVARVYTADERASLPDQAVGVTDAIALPADLPAAFKAIAARGAKLPQRRFKNGVCQHSVRHPSSQPLGSMRALTILRITPSVFVRTYSSPSASTPQWRSARPSPVREASVSSVPSRKRRAS